ncbi:unnamed protein product [Schistocephalus solidus]|uniref:Reverse transcriptase domain-containing protein n=1 Tax=Schistocephalus solidus TaxID=70667 RepID=A0A183SWI7_SCHSO|nr:unnamed protein product [Schistocephalus solidus]
MVHLTDTRTVCEAFAAIKDVKQGCLLAPTLFRLILFAMLMETYRNERLGIRITCRTDEHLNLRHTQAPARVAMTTTHDLSIVDDCTLSYATKEDMQRNLGASPQAAPISD